MQWWRIYIFVFAFIFGALGTAWATESANLAITGNILPISCNVVLDSATADFGELEWGTEGRKSVQPIDNNLTLACDDKMKATVQVDFISKLTGIDLGTEYAVAEIIFNTGITELGVLAKWKETQDPGGVDGNSYTINDLVNAGDQFGVAGSAPGRLSKSTGFTVPFQTRLLLSDLQAPRDIEELNGSVTFTVKYY